MPPGREPDVLRVPVRGRSNSQIAVELFMTANTVVAHVAGSSPNWVPPPEPKPPPEPAKPASPTPET
ncbi:LuxR C-terminal-related transcriptional regulator [Actinomadura rugatobispora]|uniref:LuxR C-terminal-related transcriptional regulator n=1 Tax=Actinomadura rugatobispora TaxID=1994 RepID=A0ABW1A8F7_9ACTN